MFTKPTEQEIKAAGTPPWKEEKPLFTNELKKGIFVHQVNGWDARIEDNLKGNTRLATVWGFVEEMGSIYSHDIQYAYKDSTGMTIEQARKQPHVPIEHTDKQKKLRRDVDDLFR